MRMRIIGISTTKSVGCACRFCCMWDFSGEKMKKLSFRKGFLPFDGLDFSKGRALSQERVLEHFNPKEVVIPMHQSIGTPAVPIVKVGTLVSIGQMIGCLLYTSDAADDLLCVDLGGRR